MPDLSAMGYLLGVVCFFLYLEKQQLFRYKIQPSFPDIANVRRDRLFIPSLAIGR